MPEVPAMSVNFTFEQVAASYLNGPDNGTQDVLETILRTVAVQAWERAHGCTDCGLTDGCSNPYVKETRS